MTGSVSGLFYLNLPGSDILWLPLKGCRQGLEKVGSFIYLGSKEISGVSVHTNPGYQPNFYKKCIV